MIPFAFPMRPAVLLTSFILVACTGVRTLGTATSSRSGAPRVGPPNGTVMVVGGGSMGPELHAAFIAAAGGPDALIIDVPTAGGDTVYPPNWRGANALKTAGARNVVVLHTKNRKVADSDSFVAPITRAGGVWFEGGRQWHLVDSYSGTRSEREFHNVLARGGIVGGSSAGASILGSYLVRGAPSNNNLIIMYPGYETGFGFLRNTGVDQHVVARERLRDLADSLLPKHPELLGISEDEGTAWLVRRDIGEIIGKSKAFVYGGRDPNDPGRPFLTLRAGDRYDLGARRVVHRAIDDSPLTVSFVDSLFADFARPGSPGATVLIAQEGRVLVNKAYGLADPYVPDSGRATYMPATTSPNFALGALSEVFNPPTTPFAPTDTAKRNGGGYRQALRRFFTPHGMQKTIADDSGQVLSNVDELYRWELGLQTNRTVRWDTSSAAAASAWRSDVYRGLNRQSAFGAAGRRRHAYARIPGHRVSILILTRRPDADVGSIADRITDRLLFTNGDARWQAQAVASTSSCRSVSAVSARVAWAGCGGGRVLRTTDGGRSWSVSSTGMPGGASSGLFGIAFADARNGLAVGGDYRIARGTAFTSDFGASWVFGDTLTSWGVGFASANVGWVAGPRGRIARFAASPAPPR